MNMKSLILLLLSLSTVVSGAERIYPLNLEFKANELKGRTKPGVTSAVSLIGGPWGRPGEAYRFNGKSNSFIEIPNGPGGPLDFKDSITILAWIYIEGGTKSGPIVNYRTNGWGIHLWLTAPTQLFVRFVRRNGGFTTPLVFNSLKKFNWNYVGCSYNHRTGVAHLWNDGKIAATRNIGRFQLATQYAIRVGARIGDGRHFKGRISCLQFYPKALDEAAVKRNRDVCKPLTHKELIYPLNDQYHTRELKGRSKPGVPSHASLYYGPWTRCGGSYRFQGRANSFIQIPNGPGGALDFKDSITILAWIYHEGKAGPIVNYKINGWAVHFWLTAPTQLFARFIKRSGPWTHPVVFNGLKKNQWNYVGCSYDHRSGVAHLWHDGKVVASRNIGSFELATKDPIRIGARIGDGRYFKGRVSCLQFYPTALTPQEVRNAKDVCK